MTFSGTDKYFSTPNHTFHYRVWSDSGDPVVLLHGLASNSHTWDLVAPHLQTSFQVIALDQRGHGESSKPDDGYDFISIANDIAVFMDSLGLDQPTLVGQSWGANVALDFATSHPDKLSRLVLIDGGISELATRPGWSWEKAEIALAPPDLTQFTPTDLLSRARSRNSNHHWDTQREQIFLSLFNVSENGTVRPHLSRSNHMKILWSIWNQSVTDLFPKVRCPVLLLPVAPDLATHSVDAVQSKYDDVNLAESLINHVQTHWMTDAIHDVQLQKPELVSDLIKSFFEATQ